MINIPDIILLNSFKAVLKLIRTDYNNNLSDTTKSLLYRLLSGNELQRYKLFDQATAALITTENDPRHFDVNMFFNAKRAAIPTLHITLSSESEKNNALANSEGYRDPVYNADNTNFTRVFNRRYGSKYNLIITSDNTNEVILFYHFMRSILISLEPHLTLSNLENIRLGGNDITIDPSLVPGGIFSRSIGIEFEYDVEAQELFTTDVTKFDFLGYIATINAEKTNNIEPT